MMNRFACFLVFAFLLIASGGVKAQEERRLTQKERIQLRAERMTDRMAEEYGLDDKQRDELLKANVAWIEKAGDMPYYGGRQALRGHRHHARRGGCCAPVRRGCCGYEEDDCCYWDERPASRKVVYKDKAAREKALKARREARKEYESRLKKILTDEQYEAYEQR